MLNQVERLKAQIRAKVEHPFHVLKNRLGYRKACYQGAGQEYGAAVDAFGLVNLPLASKRLNARRIHERPLSAHDPDIRGNEGAAEGHSATFPSIAPLFFRRRPRRVRRHARRALADKGAAKRGD